MIHALLKMTNGKQYTICWHNDESKMSHEDPKVIDSIIEMLRDSFKESTVTRVKTHTFLRMDIETNDVGTVF